MLTRIQAGLFSFDDLFRYIPKNKALKQAIDKIDLSSSEVQQLLDAIKKGDVNSAVFFNPDADIQLLVLFKQGKIECGEFLASYNYLMGLMEFTDKQPIKESDQHLKSDLAKSITLKPFFENNQLTAEGQFYISEIKKKLFVEANVTIEESDVENYLRLLSPIEQNMIVIHYSHFLNSFLVETATLSPVLVETIDDNGRIVYLPPDALQYFLLSKIGNPMQILPVFGGVTQEKFLSLHKNNKHPYALYNKYVIKNLINVNNEDEVALTVAIHDNGHRAWTSLLREEDRQLVYDLIDDLNFIKNELVQSSITTDKNTPLILQQIDKIIYDQLNDFVILPMSHYKDLSFDERLKKFIRYCFYIDQGFGNINNKEYVYGSPTFQTLDYDDVMRDLFFLIAKHYFGGTSKSPDMWQYIIHQIGKNLDERAQFRMSALCHLAFYATHAHKLDSTLIKPILNQSIEIDWEDWYDMLSTTNNSKEIWVWAAATKEYQLLQLITACKLNFCYPYLPLTLEKHAELLTFVKTNYELSKTSVSKRGFFATSYSIGSQSKQDEEPRYGII